MADAMELVECCLGVSKFDCPGDVGHRRGDLTHENTVFPAVNPETAGLAPHLATGILIAVRRNDNRSWNFRSDVKIRRGTAPIVTYPRDANRGKDFESPSHVSSSSTMTTESRGRACR